MPSETFSCLSSSHSRTEHNFWMKILIQIWLRWEQRSDDRCRASLDDRKGCKHPVQSNSSSFLLRKFLKHENYTKTGSIYAEQCDSACKGICITRRPRFPIQITMEHEKSQSHVDFENRFGGTAMQREIRSDGNSSPGIAAPDVLRNCFDFPSRSIETNVVSWDSLGDSLESSPNCMQIQPDLCTRSVRFTISCAALTSFIWLQKSNFPARWVWR